MRIDKAHTRSDPLQRKPQHQILRAVRPVQCNHLIPLYAQIFHQPVPHPLQLREELPVRPRPSIVIEKRSIGLVAGVVFEAVVEEEFVVCFSLGNELLGGCCCVVEGAGLKVVADVVFCVEVGGRGGGACYCC